MTLEYIKIDKYACANYDLLSEAANWELLSSLGIDKNFSWVPLDHYQKWKSSVTISPERGGTIPSLVLGGKQIFYNDPQRRNNPSTTARESHRIWPQFANFTEEQMKEYWYKLQQHWFLRDVRREKQKEINDQIAYLFKSNPETFSKFPHTFSALETIQLHEDSADISLYTQNTGETPMRFSPGHHTYYKIDPKRRTRIEFDDNMKITNAMKAKVLAREETLVIPNPQSCEIFLPWTGNIQLIFDEKFWYVVVRWGEKDEYICVEPIVDKTAKRLQSAILTQPREIMSVWITVKLLSKDNS